MMKNIIFLMFLLPTLMFAQSNIEGIGIFKVGKSNIAIIDSLSSKGFEFEKCDNYIFYCQSRLMSKKAIIEPTAKDKVHFPLIKERKTFFVNNYEVAGMKIRNMQLDFYKNILYHIKIDDVDLDLNEALKAKYKSTLEVDEKIVKCSSVYGEFSREENSYFTFYRNDSIFAQHTVSIYYDDQCKKQGLNYLIIRHNPSDLAVSKLEDIQRAENRKISEEQKQINLKDL